MHLELVPQARLPGGGGQTHCLLPSQILADHANSHIIGSLSGLALARRLSPINYFSSRFLYLIEDGANVSPCDARMQLSHAKILPSGGKLQFLAHEGP